MALTVRIAWERFSRYARNVSQERGDCKQNTSSNTIESETKNVTWIKIEFWTTFAIIKTTSNYTVFELHTWCFSTTSWTHAKYVAKIYLTTFRIFSLSRISAYDAPLSRNRLTFIFHIRTPIKVVLRTFTRKKKRTQNGEKSRIVFKVTWTSSSTVQDLFHSSGEAEINDTLVESECSYIGRKKFTRSDVSHELRDRMSQSAYKEVTGNRSAHAITTSPVFR